VARVGGIARQHYENMRNYAQITRRAAPTAIEPIGEAGPKYDRCGPFCRQVQFPLVHFRMPSTLAPTQAVSPCRTELAYQS
jgi:hypothetical protein